MFCVWALQALLEICLKALVAFLFLRVLIWLSVQLFLDSKYSWWNYASCWSESFLGLDCSTWKCADLQSNAWLGWDWTAPYWNCAGLWSDSFWNQGVPKKTSKRWDPVIKIPWLLSPSSLPLPSHTLTGTLPSFMFKNYVVSACTFLSGLT